ncbi:MAG: restriction endonuclease subunit S [Arcobacteraceae bacterium]|nr:restriction endonuclease subunit S [Arcobacteraceae bacterium]
MAELYQLPDGWEWKTIDEFATIKSGKRVPKGKKLLDDVTPYPYIRVTDFADNGTVDTLDIKYISEDIYQQIKNYTITDEDIYISVAGTIGKTGIIPSELNRANLTENAVKIVFDNSKYDKNFIFNFTNSITFMEQIGLATKTVAMPKLAIKRLKEVFIPLPPLEEQKRIVSKLDTLFEKIDKSISLHQKNIDEANVFMASVLNDVFVELEEKYERRTVFDLCTKITDGTHATPKYIDSGVPFLSVKNISQGIISFDDTKYVSEEEHLTLSKRCNVERDDILYTKVGTTGIAKVVDTDIEFSIFVSIALLKPKKDLISSMYFQHILNSPNCYKQSQNRTRGVANRNLVLNDIKQINFPLPPIQTQQKVVAYLDEISQKIEILKKAQNDKMQSLKSLKASILDKAFRGEI